MAPVTRHVYSSPLVQCTTPLVFIGSSIDIQSYPDARHGEFLSAAEGNCVCAITNVCEFIECQFTIPGIRGVELCVECPASPE